MHRLLILSACLLMVSCDPLRVYETNRDFDNGYWSAKDTAAFAFSIVDTTTRYNIILNIRNTIDYETARLYLNYSLADSASMPLRKRMLEQMLFDKKSGKPFGNSGLGDIYEHQVLIERSITFPATGPYAVKLTQMMRTDTLREVLSVGIRVERAGDQ